jgi:hypothetical protein
MSYEGIEQFLCPKGHLAEVDSSQITYGTDEERKALLKCPHCKQNFVLYCSVNFTNGYDEDDPTTSRGKVKEAGFSDIWRVDHYNNRYATKLIEYVPDDPTRWKKLGDSE